MEEVPPFSSRMKNALAQLPTGQSHAGCLQDAAPVGTAAAILLGKLPGLMRECKRQEGMGARIANAIEAPTSFGLELSRRITTLARSGLLCVLSPSRASLLALRPQLNIRRSCYLSQRASCFSLKRPRLIAWCRDLPPKNRGPAPLKKIMF